jgi:DNA-directed RNA polymerase specialized sigma24 family protein
LKKYGPREAHGRVQTVHQTFEEFAAERIDDLYHGALFLHGGEEGAAEDLVLWTMTGAFQQFKRLKTGSANGQWLEGKLVEAFLARTGWESTGEGRTDEGRTDEGGSTVPHSGDDPSTADFAGLRSSPDPMEIDPEALFRAAGKLPNPARAAIWLVLFRRWRYEEACSVLGTDVAGLKGLLRGRQVLLTAVVRRSENRNGTDHGRRR